MIFVFRKVNVGMHCSEEKAEPEPEVTVIGAKTAPCGTVTVMESWLAAVAALRTVPKNTILFEGVALKLVPLMTTWVPMGPDIGETEVMTGT